MNLDWVRCDGRGFQDNLPRAQEEVAPHRNEAGFSLSRRALLGGALASIAWSSSRSALADVVFDVSHQAAERGAVNETRPVLVTIFLRGGADGLNILVPHGDADYLKARPTLGIAAPRGRVRADQAASDRAVDLDGFFGLHPALSPLLPLYREGRLAGIHACGSRDESRSHFEAMATVECGRDGDENDPGNLARLQSTLGISSEKSGGKPVNAAGGWLARHLASAPDGNNSPLRAVAFGGTMPESLRGATDATALGSLSDFHLALPPSFAAHSGPFRDALAAMYGEHGDDITRAGRETLDVLRTVNRLDPKNYKPSHGATYPSSELGEGLKQVACLIGARVGLEVACLDRGGWDTHIAQGSSAGWMASQLSDVAQSLAAFARDLGPNMNRVTVVVLSEFGRRAGENGALGTDHGRGGAMLIAGGDPSQRNAIRGGRIYGRWPGLSADALEGPGDLRVTTDYRDVLAEIAARRLHNPHTEAIFPGHQTKFLNLVST